MSTSRVVPIADYGLIGDTRAAALVAPDGAIDWLCLPRFDSPPVFGRLVGGDGGGTFSIAPNTGAQATRRRYRPRTATLETTWRVDGSEIVLADAMIAEVAGRLLPSTVLVRRIEVRGQPVRMRVCFDPRFGYDQRPPRRVRRVGDATVIDGGLALALTTDAHVVIRPGAEIVFEADPHRPTTFVLTAAHRAPAVIVPPAIAQPAVRRDEDGWRGWADTIDLDTPHHELVVRSLLTLQLLTYSPSGAPVAAPTTSLPEATEGGRNWDYRYAWPRDASIGVAAFLAAGKHQEAGSFLAWLVHASRLSRPRLPPMFDLDGRPAARERRLDRWPGYDGNEPVRVGNDATDQQQLDGYGWVIDAASLYVQAGHRLDGETWRAIAAFADHVAASRHEPDAGIWERRDGPRHHVHSKLMAWLALDRAAGLAARRTDRRSARRRQRWITARDGLAEEIRARGFNQQVDAYTAAYDVSDLDASLLLLPAIGFESPSSPRVMSTIDTIRRRLSAGGPLLLRYVDDDGLPGREGAFLPCSFWLVQALALSGRRDEAAELFDQLAAIGGPLGLFAEELDPATGGMLGNYPQALTHAALLQAALALRSGCERGGSPRIRDARR